MYLVLVLLCVGSLSKDGAPLLDEAFFNTGKTDFSPLEVVLIAEGVNERQALAGYMQKYERLLEGMALSDKLAGQSDKKKVKSLLKNLFATLKGEAGESAGIRALVDEGRYSELSATLVFYDLAARNGINPSETGAPPKGLDPFFFSGQPATIADVAAANMVAGALHGADDPAASLAMLRASKALSDTGYGTGTLDVRLYQKAYELYQAESMEAAAMLGRTMDQGDEIGLSIAQKLNNNIITLDEAETQRWKDAATPLIEAWQAEMDAKGLDGKALVEEARALVDKHSAGM